METSVLRLPAADLRAARRHATLYVLSASARFTIGSAVVKALTADFLVLEIVMFRERRVEGQFPKGRFGRLGLLLRTFPCATGAYVLALFSYSR